MPPLLPLPALPAALAPAAPVPPVAPVLRGRGRAGRRRVGRGAAGGGARQVGERSGPPCRGRCCRWAGGGGGCGAPASAGYQGGGTIPPGFPAAGVPHPPFLVRCSSFSPPVPSMAQVTHPLLPPGPDPCPLPLALARSLPRAPLPVSRVSPSVTHSLSVSAGAGILPMPRPVLLAVSCVPPSAARALSCFVCLSSPRCCLHRRPARAPALVSVPWRCCPCLRPPLALVPLLRVRPSLCHPPPLAPCSRGWHPAPPECGPPPS